MLISAVFLAVVGDYFCLFLPLLWSGYGWHWYYNGRFLKLWRQPKSKVASAISDQLKRETQQWGVTEGENNLARSGNQGSCLFPGDYMVVGKGIRDGIRALVKMLGYFFHIA